MKKHSAKLLTLLAWIIFLGGLTYATLVPVGEESAWIVLPTAMLGLFLVSSVWYEIFRSPSVAPESQFSGDDGGEWGGYEGLSSMREEMPAAMTHQIEELQAKALTGDKLAAAQFRAAKWNDTVPVGANCLYLKSEIEGKVIAKLSRAAWVSGEYVFVELEHIGMVLLDKVEVFFE